MLHQAIRLKLHGDFVWKPDGSIKIRSRNNTNIPAERIAPEDIQEAISLVLRTGRGFTRAELINETRAVFGFTRTGASLQQTINSAVEILLAKGIIGECSLGIAIRNNDLN